MCLKCCEFYKIRINKLVSSFKCFMLNVNRVISWDFIYKSLNEKEAIKKIVPTNKFLF